jgi:hypothetical protein
LGGTDIYASKSGSILQFKELIAGTGIVLGNGTKTIKISTPWFVPAGFNVFFGKNAGRNNTCTYAIGLGYGANSTDCFSAGNFDSIAIGKDSGNLLGVSGSVSSHGVCIGNMAGYNPRRATHCTYIGTSAGETATPVASEITLAVTASTGIGYYAGRTSQGNNSVAVGTNAGEISQGASATAVGYYAGNNTQGANTVAVGSYAGQTNQGNTSIAIGAYAGNSAQGVGAIAIGTNAGKTTQGTNSIAIGAFAGETNQHSGTIIINATGSPLNSTSTNSLYIAPIRLDTTSSNNPLIYNPATFEVICSAKTFIIDHPIHNDRYLVHACIESPESSVMYRGTGEIDSSNECTIILPEYCIAWFDFAIIISAIGSPNPNIYSTEVINNSFTVYGNVGKFKWIVYATRGIIEVEPDKNKYDLKGDGPYTYLSKK